MTQIEINIPSSQAKAFDAAFWCFVQSELSGEAEPDVQMDVISLGDFERRVVGFGCGYQAEAFARHWRVARR